MHVKIFHKEQLVDDAHIPYERTFGEVALRKPLVYINSLLNVAVALNQSSYANAHKIGSGPDWFIEVSKD